MAVPSSTSYFELQRAELLREISLSFEQVLQNINRLNRNLESVNAVGNEFSSVEALWSQFENVMGKEGEVNDSNAGHGSGENDDREGRPRGQVGSQQAARGEVEVKQENEGDDETILRDEEGYDRDEQT